MKAKSLSQLLDENKALHFSLLRLQLIELIRDAGPSAEDCQEAIDFAAANLAPRASENQQFLHDLEYTMSLLIFQPKDRTPAIAKLLDPSLRQQVASDVNTALLEASGRSGKATLHELIHHRAWAHKKALKEKKDSVTEVLDLGLDPSQAIPPKENGSPAGNGEGEAMATGWDGQS